MGDTIQQAIGSLSAGSPEFKRALKVLIKYEIHCLLQRLSDTGEEAIVITTSIEDGIQEQLGTSKGEGFLRHTHTLEQLKEQFLLYCTDEASVSACDDVVEIDEPSEENLTSLPNTGQDKDTAREEDRPGAQATDPGIELVEVKSAGPDDVTECRAGADELTAIKPVDFSWKMEKIITTSGVTKSEVDFSDCSNKKYCSGSDGKCHKRAVCEPVNCRLTPSLHDMAYLFNTATVCAKDGYQEEEVQDLSIHQRGTNMDKTENTATPQARKKRKSSRVSSTEQESLQNGGLYKILPNHLESSSVIPRCHLDLSVSRIVENLSKAVGEKWTEDEYEVIEQERDGKKETSIDNKNGPVYFKCSESSLLDKATDPVYSKSMSMEYSGSEETSSWQQEDPRSSAAASIAFDSWVPPGLKKESDQLGSCKVEEQNSVESHEITIKSEVKIEADYGDPSLYEKMDQSLGAGKFPNNSPSHGATPIQLNFICKICGQNFRNRQYRDFHVKLHKSSHSFLCNLCSAGFDSEVACSEHQKLHTDPIYQCDNCGYRCTREFRMRAHKEICGEPAKIYKCPFCDKQFAAQRYMRIHMKSHDTRNVHTCPHCQNTYPLKNSLLKHMKKKHSA